jgi:hypothetical protein
VTYSPSNFWLLVCSSSDRDVSRVTVSQNLTSHTGKSDSCRTMIAVISNCKMKHRQPNGYSPIVSDCILSNKLNDSGRYFTCPSIHHQHVPHPISFPSSPFPFPSSPQSSPHPQSQITPEIHPTLNREFRVRLTLNFRSQSPPNFSQFPLPSPSSNPFPIPLHSLPNSFSILSNSHPSPARAVPLTLSPRLTV